MEDVNLFLTHAIQLERDAARRFEDLMHAMQSVGNREVEMLFRRLGDFSRRHLESAMARGGFRELPEVRAEDMEWPEGITPEAAGWHGVDSTLDVLSALELALSGERSGYGYYAAVADKTKNPEVARMAKSFAAEESQHVAELEKWIRRMSAATANAT